MLVLFYHFFSFFRIGWIGVDLFFVLSGFLITSILLRSRHTPSYFRNFYIRRSLRILPLYYLVLIIFYIAAPIVFSQTNSSSTYSYYTENQHWYWLFGENWLFIKKGLPPEPYLQHFWTLAVEEQFYLLWPVVVFLLKNLQQLKRTIIFLFFLALSIRLMSFYIIDIPLFTNYYNSFARMDSLTTGAYLAVSIYQKKNIHISFIVIFTIGFMALIGLSWIYCQNFSHDNRVFATIGYSVIAVFFMCMCYMALQEKSWMSRMYFLKPLGRISYGLYVFHLPVLLVLSTLLSNRLNRYLPVSLLRPVISIICLISTLIISILSYKIVELPLLRLKSKFR